MASPSRWNVLIDAVIVNNTILVPSSSVDGAPSNKAVALIDSGASYSYVFSVAVLGTELRHFHKQDMLPRRFPMPYTAISLVQSLILLPDFGCFPAMLKLTWHSRLGQFSKISWNVYLLTFYLVDKWYPCILWMLTQHWQLIHPSAWVPLFLSQFQLMCTSYSDQIRDLLTEYVQ